MKLQAVKMEFKALVLQIVGIAIIIILAYLVFSTGITGLALAWIITGIMACVTIKRGLVQEHREWMMRNYVLTFAFVSYRVGLKYMLGEGFMIADTVIMSWLCWVPQLFVTELLIQISHSRLFKKKGKSFRQSVDSGMVISAE